jgi:Asp-tRNA(Asn)/Glu-tRNA(Gln) amidotransferase A subunit family amidase
MSSPGIFRMSAVELGDAVQAKRTSAREIVQATLAQLARVNLTVNAIVTLAAPDDLLAQARAADEASARGDARGPLHGLPIGVKDTFETRGIRTTYGSPLFADYFPPHDAYIVKRGPVFRSSRRWRSTARRLSARARFSGRGPVLARLEARRFGLWQRMQRFMATYEFFVLPVSQVLPFDVALPYPTEIAGVRMESYIAWMKSAWYISTTGNPALALPAAFSNGGLPIGVQIVGRHHDDLGVFQLGHAFSKPPPVGMRKPAIASGNATKGSA